jgi:26S proteasome regulatory subunit, ATPase 3, interacting protein
LTELRTIVTHLEGSHRDFQERLSKLQSNADGICPQKLDRVEREWKTWQKHCLTRKKIFFDLWSKCTEILPEDMTKEELQVWMLPFCTMTASLKLP